MKKMDHYNFFIINENEWNKYYQRNRDFILNRAKDYYKNSKEILTDNAIDKYRNLSEEANKKRGYGKNIYDNMSEKKKKTKKISKKLLRS